MAGSNPLHPSPTIAEENRRIRTIVRRLILAGKLPRTSPHSGLSVQQYNALMRAQLWREAV